jgi:hypothetical protein
MISVMDSEQKMTSTARNNTMVIAMPGLLPALIVYRNGRDDDRIATCRAWDRADGLE